MNQVKQWYAIHTRSGHERRIVDILSKKRFENYCPITKTVRQVGQTKRLFEQPVFPRCIFVHITASEIHIVNSIDGVISMWFWLGKPAIIPDLEIKSIEAFTTTHKSVSVKKVKVTQLAVVEQPAFADDETGELETPENVIVPTLGYCITALQPHPDIRDESQPMFQRWTHHWVQWEQKLIHSLQVSFRN